MYKLCGGTLLVLILNSRKKNKNEISLLETMLGVLSSELDIERSTQKEQTKKFKICKEHSMLATPFEKRAMQDKMAKDIRESYDYLLERTKKFVENYVDTDSDTHKDEILVKAILEVIEQDTSISDDKEFYILPNGKSVTKERLVSIKKIYLPSFMLGVLYYVMMNIKDNKDGAETYDKWCPKPHSGTMRRYTANIGENSSRQIVLINTPDEYDIFELLDLADELVLLYVKPIPSDSNFDITTTTFIIADNIDEFEKEDYIELQVSSCDGRKIKELIADCNELICCVNKYHDSVNKNDIVTLNQTKECFFNKWLSFPHKFEDSSTQELSDNILLRIEQNKVIDIENITIIPKKLKITELPKNSLDSFFKTQKIHYYNCPEETLDSKIKHLTSISQKKKNK